MPSLSVDLDGKKKMAPCARAAGVDVGVIAWGLLELWEHVWVTKQDIVSRVIIEGCFGREPRVREALIAYNFIEAKGDDFRAKGAARYLRVSQGLSLGGQKAKGNLKQFRQSREQPDSATGSPPAIAGDQPEPKTGSTPITDHRSPITDHRSPTTFDGNETPSPAPPPAIAGEQPEAAGRKVKKQRGPSPAETWFEAFVEPERVRKLAEQSGQTESEIGTLRDTEGITPVLINSFAERLRKATGLPLDREAGGEAYTGLTCTDLWWDYLDDARRAGTKTTPYSFRYFVTEGVVLELLRKRQAEDAA
jgi:hypothetical protein